MQKKAYEDLVAEVQELRAQLEEAQETLDAIRRGEVDGLVVSTPKGEQVYTISGAERPYRALIEDMREGAVMLSDDNTVLYCNSGFAKMMKRPYEKIVGAKIESMVCPTYIPVLKELLSLSRAHKGAITKEVALQARSDVLVPTLMSVNSLQSDTIKNTFLVVTDLSKHMSKEVKHYTQELEATQAKLEGKAAEVEEYANRMEELAQARLEKLKDSERLATIGQVAGMVGHDIRNPLQSISSDIYLAMSELIDIPSSKQKECILESLKEINCSVDYINKIVQDLQDYSKVLKPTIKATDLTELFGDILSKTNIPKNIVTSCKVEDTLKSAMVDPELLRRILTNLISNAVQAMASGGRLSFDAHKETEDIVITVKDTGVGVSQENKSKLFTPLFTTRSKGQGFGLPVVKRMTDALGGTVSFESEEGKGTTFIVRLPPPKK